MSLELVSTLAAVGTFFVIAATAIAAVIQLRHLRASNQLTAFMTITDKFDDAEFRRLLAYVRNELGDKARDPEYRTELLGSRGVDRIRFPEVIVCGFFEELGIFVKRGLVDKDVFLDAYSNLIIRNWKNLEPFIACTRVNGGPAVWENFEYLLVMAKRWNERYPEGTLPKNFPREVLSEEWSLKSDEGSLRQAQDRRSTSSR